MDKNIFSSKHVQIHPTHLIFDVLSEIEAKIDQKHDFGLFLRKVKKSFFNYNFFCEKALKM
jgi:hypothetical protein